MTNELPETIARAYLAALAAKDFSQLERLLDPAIHFVGPAFTLDNARDVLASFRRISAVHVRTDLVRVFTAGTEVCVIYDFVTDVVGAVPTVEWIRIHAGRVCAVNLYYDQVPWLKVREELARRA